MGIKADPKYNLDGKSFKLGSRDGNPPNKQKSASRNFMQDADLIFAVSLYKLSDNQDKPIVIDAAGRPEILVKQVGSFLVKLKSDILRIYRGSDIGKTA